VQTNTAVSMAFLYEPELAGSSQPSSFMDSGRQPLGICGTDVLLVTQSIEALKKTRSTNPNWEELHSGLILDSSTAGQPVF